MKVAKGIMSNKAIHASVIRRAIYGPRPLPSNLNSRILFALYAKPHLFNLGCILKSLRSS